MYSSNARFCLICNYVNRIIPALQSRCTKMRFCPLEPRTALERIQMIVQREQFAHFTSFFYLNHCLFISFSIVADPEALKEIIEISDCDMRKILNTLQSVSMAYDRVTIDNIYKTTGKPHPHVVSEMLEIALNSPFQKAVEGLFCFICSLISIPSLTHDIHLLHPLRLLAHPPGRVVRSR